MYVDAMSLHMVATPSDWDVLVMENQFGDILSDLGAAIVGGLVMAPSAEIGDKHALFQPSHGMMLDWLGERHDDQAVRDAATMIETTVAGLLANGKLKTADQGRHGHNIGRCQNNLGRDSSESIQRRSLDLRNVSANLV
jgi:3-isopropylmalate dehydrogenase